MGHHHFLDLMEIWYLETCRLWSSTPPMCSLYRLMHFGCGTLSKGTSLLVPSLDRGLTVFLLHVCCHCDNVIVFLTDQQLVSLGQNLRGFPGVTSWSLSVAWMGHQTDDFASSFQCAHILFLSFHRGVQAKWRGCHEGTCNLEAPEIALQHQEWHWVHDPTQSQGGECGVVRDNVPVMISLYRFSIYIQNPGWQMACLPLIVHIWPIAITISAG